MLKFAIGTPGEFEVLEKFHRLLTDEQIIIENDCCSFKLYSGEKFQNEFEMVTKIFSQIDYEIISHTIVTDNEKGEYHYFQTTMPHLCVLVHRRRYSNRFPEEFVRRNGLISLHARRIFKSIPESSASPADVASVPQVPKTILLSTIGTGQRGTKGVPSVNDESSSSSTIEYVTFVKENSSSSTNMKNNI